MRVALINIQGADDPTLVSKAFTSAFGKEVEVKLFTSELFGDQVVQNSAAFVLERLPDKTFNGKGNRAILSPNASEQETRMAKKMEKTGLTVLQVNEDFDSSRSDEDQKVWVETGSYPVPVAAEAEEESAAFSYLWDDDEDDTDPVEPEVITPIEPVQEAITAPAPRPALEEAPKSNSGISIEGGLEDIPLPGIRTAPEPVRAEVEQEPAPVYASRREVRQEVQAPAPISVEDEDSIPEPPKFRSLPVDSMGANDVPVTRRTTREIPVSTGPEIPAYVEDDEPAPLPRRQAPVREEAPAPAAPVYPAIPVNDHEDEEAQYQPQTPAPQPISLDFDDDQDDSLPEPPVVRQAPAPIEVEEPVGLPSWEDFQKRSAPQPDPQPSVTAPAPIIDDYDPEEPPAPLPSRRARRAETPSDFDDREQEPAAPVRRQEPVYEAPRAEEPQYNYPEEQAPAPRARQESEYVPAPAPAARPIVISDPMVAGYDEPAKRYQEAYTPPAMPGGRNSMADELNMDEVRSAAAKRHENAERRRLAAIQEQQAARSAQRPNESWEDDQGDDPEEPETQQRQVAPQPRSEMPEAFRVPPTLEDEVLEQVNRAPRPKRSMMEELQEEFGPKAGRFIPASDGAFIIYVTGSRGGAGKSTISYLLAQVLASACKKAGRGEEVYLLEGDYENPKLSHRLGLPRSQNLGELARFYETIQQERALPGGNRFQVDATGRAIIDKIAYEMPDSGLKVLACPYDLTTRKSSTIRLAMQKAINQVSKTAKYIIIDGDTLSNDDVLDRELISRAHHTIIVAWGNSDEDMSDGIRSAHTLKTAEANGGMGIPAKRVSMFFNRTDYNTVEAIKVKIRPHSVSGYIPDLPDFKDHWIGSVEPTANFNNAVQCVAKAANTIYPNDDLIPFANRQISKNAPGTSAKRKGLFSRFMNKG